MDARTAWMLLHSPVTFKLTQGQAGVVHDPDLFLWMDFSGASKTYYGARVSKLTAHREKCEAPQCKYCIRLPNQPSVIEAKVDRLFIHGCISQQKIVLTRELALENI